MVRSTRAANAQCRHAETFERLHPRLEDRRGGFVPLQIDTSNSSRTVINVEVTVEFRMFRLQFHIRAIGKVLRHVGARSKKTFFFTGPQSKPDGAPHLEACGF